MSEEESCYSNDEEYFLDLCRSGDMEEIKEFMASLTETSEFNWGWFNDSQDNFIHMLAANNFPEIFDFLFPILKTKCSQTLPSILNKQNFSSNTPLHYAVVTDSKEMVAKLIEAGADTTICNQHERNPFQQAQQFGKYEIAKELLAPVTKIDIEKIEKMTGDLKLNDDSSDEEEQKMQQKAQQ